MRDVGSASRRAGVLTIAATLASLTHGAAQAAEGTAAHTLAQKFAAEGPGDKSARASAGKAAEATEQAAAKAREAQRKAAEAKRKADEARRLAKQLKADEEDMLERARTEARERQIQQERAQEELGKAERDREAAEARELAVKSAESRKVHAERATQEAEQRRAAAERAAEEARQALQATQRAAEEAEKARNEHEHRRAEAECAAQEAERAAREAEERRIAEEGRLKEAVGQLELRKAQADREEEARRLTDKLRKAAAAYTEREKSEQHSPGLSPVVLDPPAPAPSSRTGETRVAVLLIMDAGRTGIRRFEKTGDPVLCQGTTCYVSTGPATPAKQTTRFGALGTANTLGARAGSCKHSLTCVFRGVELGGASAEVQPIDLRILRHDRRETLKVSADETCTIEAAHLSCASLVTASSWRAWIVPESVAAQAGPEALTAALQAGLPEARAAAYVAHQR